MTLLNTFVRDNEALIKYAKAEIRSAKAGLEHLKGVINSDKLRLEEIRESCIDEDKFLEIKRIESLFYHKGQAHEIKSSIKMYIDVIRVCKGINRKDQ
jgi:hypothetical protein